MHSSPREKRAVALMVLLLAVVVGGRSFWQNSLNRFVILRSDAPDKAVIIEAANGGKNIADFCTRLLASGKMPHRVAAIELLLMRRTEGLSSNLVQLLMEAGADPDPLVCGGSLTLLGKVNRFAAVELARALIFDRDPARRILGLEQLRSLQATNTIDSVASLLDDSDSRVRVQSAQVLGALLGRDFGIKIGSAPPIFRSPGVPALRADVENAIRRVRDDWSLNRVGSAAVPSKDFQNRSAVAVKPQFLGIERGRDLATSEGRAIWLSFLEQNDDNSQTLEQLRLIKKSHADLRVIIAPVVDACESHHDQQAECHTHVPIKTEFELIHDSKVLAAVLAINDLPTHVLINASGRVERKFSGFRETGVLDQMLNNIAKRKPHR